MPVKRHKLAVLFMLALVALPLTSCGPNEPDIRAEDVDTAQVVTWIEETAFPLSATDMTDDTSDLEWLRETIGNARIVGLGDQTNGTKESITLNKRITDFLLEEMGFTLIATSSCSWGDSLTTDRYVSEGKGRSRGAREGFTSPLDFSEEILNTLVWARRYKVHHPETPLHLVGINLLSPHTSFEWCKNILLGAGCTLRQSTLRDIERLEYLHFRMWGDRDKQADYFTLATSLMDEIKGIIPDYEHKLTPLELAIIERIPKAHAQYEEYLRIIDETEDANEAGWYQQAFDYYNQCLDETLSWWMDALGTESKIVLWAHNGEIAKQWPEAGVVSLGQHLSSTHGKDYITIGFSAGGGIVYAPQRDGGDYLGYGQGLVPEPILESYESVLCNTTLADYALDLRDLEPRSNISVWMNESRPFKILGDTRHTTHSHLDTAFNTPHTLPAMFDLILHVQFTRGIEQVY